MKQVLLTLSLLALTLNAHASDGSAKEISPASLEGKALVKAIMAAPAVRGALAQIKEAVAKARPYKCFPVRFELTTESFQVFASCNGGYAEDGEFSELVTIEGSVYDAKTVHVNNIKFDMAD